MNRSLLLYNATLRVLGTGFLALGHHVHTLYNGTLFFYEHLQYLTLLALAGTRVYVYGIAFLNM
jgi:hypothetical protein